MLRLSADYTKDDSNARGGHRLIPGLLSGAPVLDDVFNTRGGLIDPKRRWCRRASPPTASRAWPTGSRFKSITAYRKDDSDDADRLRRAAGGRCRRPAIYKNKQFSQEFQLEIDRGPLAGVARRLLSRRRRRHHRSTSACTRQRAHLPGPHGPYRRAMSTPRPGRSSATSPMRSADQWRVSLGGRYTSDKRHAGVAANLSSSAARPPRRGAAFGDGIQLGAPTSNFDGKRKDTAFTPRASVSFKPNDDHHFYASCRRASRAAASIRAANDHRRRTSRRRRRTPDEVYEFMAFDPETVTSYELGWKASAVRQAPVDQRRPVPRQIIRTSRSRVRSAA